MKHGKNLVGPRRKVMFLLYVLFLAALSVSLLLMPFGIRLADRTLWLTYTSGVLFWVGLLGTVVMVLCIAGSCRRDKRRSPSQPQSNPCGLVRFFQNTPATVCDILMMVSFAGWIATCIWARMTIWPFPFLSLFVFSFGMHCMLNGSNYIYLKS